MTHANAPTQRTPLLFHHTAYNQSKLFRVFFLRRLYIDLTGSRIMSDSVAGTTSPRACFGPRLTTTISLLFLLYLLRNINLVPQILRILLGK